MGVKDIFKILILFIIFIAFIIWLAYYLYSIRLQNRIKNTTIKVDKKEKDSIFDNIANWYLKEKNKIINKYIDSKINSRQKELALSTFIDSITYALLLIVGYLFLSLFYLTKPESSILLLLTLIGLLIPNLINYTKENIRKKEIEKDLLKAITLINNGLSSGKSIRKSIEDANNKLDGSIKEEFTEVVNDLEHGLSLQVAFDRMEKRTNVSDIVYLTTTLSMLSKTGGNLVLMFDYLEKIFKTRKKLDQELESSIASSKLVFILMSIIPAIVFIGMMFLDTNYLKLFFETPLGNLLIIIILSLYGIYIFIIRKIIKIDKY